ncbi:hypothetical protein JKF63_07860 [Porcisia hertigi]|uniref:Uncharacterized protein n=1 Tax=Porcisia hertigi TaxID=2761500 RepID=A0A836LJR3_9TRYP|nr:hypothetical protein JKF63_07860 [Porcisia hertigi]
MRAEKAATTTTQYTRSAILAWANDALETSYASFQEIPSHEVGLLLYGALQPSSLRADVSAGGLGDSTAVAATASNGDVPLLSEEELHTHHQRHQATCMRYLQLLQFPPIPGPATQTNSAVAAVISLATAATPSLSTSPGTQSGSTSAVAQQRNAEHVLAMIRALSAEEAHLLRSEASDTPTGGGSGNNNNNTANVVLVLGPSLTPATWLSGGAFVEELKLWRWIRLMAERHRSSTTAIRRVIRAYLQHEEGVAPPTPMPAKGVQASPANCDESRDALLATGSPVVTAEMDTDEAVLPEMKRMRPDIPPPFAAAEAAVLSAAPLTGSVSPVQALLSPMEEAKNVNGARTDDGSATGLSYTKPDNRLHTASTATITPYVAQAPQLQAMLCSAQVTLQNELTLRRSQPQPSPPQPPISASGSTSHRSSGSDIPGGAGAIPKVPLLTTLAMNPCEVQENSCRRHMVNTVLSQITDLQGDASVPLPVPEGLTCDVCPSIMAHAIQCNLAAIDNLEDIRARAIAACLKRDPVALLAALQSIV